MTFTDVKREEKEQVRLQLSSTCSMAVASKNSICQGGQHN